MSQSLELQQLKEIIETFPAEYSVEDVEAANALLKIRYDVLDNTLVHLLHDSIADGHLSLDTDTCFSLCTYFHASLFHGIISIDGKFRQPDHPNGGAVFFGGQKRQEAQPKFRGSPPQNIKSDLKKAFAYLGIDDPDLALDNALHFYQEFVFTHPFYDGNGRIARLFVNLYLMKYNLSIDWKNLHEKGHFSESLTKFMKLVLIAISNTGRSLVKGLFIRFQR